MNINIKIPLLLFCIITIGLLYGCGEETIIHDQPNNTDSAHIFRTAFTEPEQCASCHPKHFKEWQISMHAYAMKDPVFHALDSIGQIRSNNRLNQFCRECHSPIGSLSGETPIGYNRNTISKLAVHGISCDVCHSMKSPNPGGNIPTFRTDKVKQGSIPNPIENSFHKSEFVPKYATSEICEPCHMVTSPNGIVVEETFKEWKQSVYPARPVSCQECHMHYSEGPAAIGGPIRKVHEHKMIGVDIPLTDDFPGREETIKAVDSLLRFSSKYSIFAPDSVRRNTSFKVRGTVYNSTTGHNLPSGTIYERQMWIEMLAIDKSTGDTLYKSGTLDANGDLRNHNSEYVKKGLISKDNDLTIFNGIAKKHGKEIDFFWEADAIENRTIPPFESRSGLYSLPSLNVNGTIIIISRLKFRALPPYLLRKIGHSSLVKKLVIFTMDEQRKEIVVY
jgi:hypothetical protein